MKMAKKLVCEVASAAVVMLAAGVCQAVPGLYQKKLSGSFNTTDDPSIGGVIVPGAGLASVAGSSYTYNGTTYSMAGSTTYAYKGYMFFKGGVTYNFVKRYDDSGLVRITKSDGTVVTPISSSSYRDTVYGSFTPDGDGYYGIDLRVGNGSGGMGPDLSPFNAASKLGAGLAWNTNGVTTCTDSNYQSWRKFMNTADDVFLYSEHPKFSILPVAPVVIDGVHPVRPTVVVTNLLTGTRLQEGVDYDLYLDDIQTLPGAHTLVISNRLAGAADKLLWEVPHTVRLAATAKRPRLPAGYAPVDWIATSKKRGTPQYLNTGYTPLAGTRVECDCYVSSANTEAYESMWGSRGAGNFSNAFFFFVRYGGNVIAYGHLGCINANFSFPYDRRVMIEAEGTTVRMVSTEAGKEYDQSFTISGTPVNGSTPMHVFNFSSSNGAGDSNTAASLYSFRMLDDGIVSCWMVPCVRISDGMTGAFDAALSTTPESAFHAHSGSTPFTRSSSHAEPAVNDGELDFFVSAADANFLDFIHSVNTNAYVGASATLEWATSPDFSGAVSRSLGTVDAWGVDVTNVVSGLPGETTYYLRLTLEKAGLPDLVRTISAQTLDGAGAISQSCALDWFSGKNPALSGEVTVFGSGATHTVRVLVGETDNPLAMTAQASAEMTSADAFTLEFPWPSYFKTLYYCLSYETEKGTCYSAVKSYLPTYTAIYTWKSAVADGDWTNGANWTISSSTATNPTHGYPDLDYFEATLPSGTYRIHASTLPLAIKCLNVSGGTYATLVGDNTAPSYITGSMRLNSSGAKQLTLDHVAYHYTVSMGVSQDHVAADTLVRLQNYASLTNATGGYPQYFDGFRSSIEITGKSVYNITSANTVWVVTGGHVLIDDGEFRNMVAVNLNTATSTEALWTFSGAAPLLRVSTATLGGSAGARLVFDVPSSGFAAAPMQMTHATTKMLATCSGPVTIQVPDSSDVWESNRPLVVPLISAPAGIVTNRIELVAPKRSSGRFVWGTTDGKTDPTTLSFVYRPGGTVYYLR